MSRDQLFTAILALLSVCLGSLLTYLSSGAQYRRQQVAEKSKRRAEKFEELIAILFEHKQWLDTFRRINLLGHERELAPSPLPRAEAIVTAYFPSFRKELSELDLAGDHYEIWMLEGAQERLAGESIAEVSKGLPIAYQPYLEKFVALIKRLHDFAETEFR